MKFYQVFLLCGCNYIRPFDQMKSVVHRGMDRIRRSFRESFRRRMSKQHFSRRTPSGRQLSPNRSANNSGSNKAELWQPDEVAVRNGTCNFSVKYLGGIEVFESRGMQICEGALKLLRVCFKKVA
ncbi:unnamed protein product [Brugia timori]|uniref:PID domain-containing protein n=1 Tax=Brugia timori TaxID=42155 RepID=A0A0R3RA77_9BILA|nr:unnamed protein product [Brugia timori]